MISDAWNLKECHAWGRSTAPTNSIASNAKITLFNLWLCLLSRDHKIEIIIASSKLLTSANDLLLCSSTFPSAPLKTQEPPATLFCFDQEVLILHFIYLIGGGFQKTPFPGSWVSTSSAMFVSTLYVSHQWPTSLWIFSMVCLAINIFPSNKSVFLFFHKIHRIHGKDLIISKLSSCFSPENRRY